MDNLYVHIKKTAIVSIGIIGVALLIWFVTRSPVVLGFAFGCLVSMFNTYIMYQNIEYIADKATPFGEAPSQNNDRESVRPKRKPIFGLGTRVFFVVGALYTAYKFESLNLVSTLIGVFFTLLVSYTFILMEIVSTTHAKGGKM